jgi:hypothetical protein
VKVFFAEVDISTDIIMVLSFDSQTLKQIEKVTVQVPAGLLTIEGPVWLVQLAKVNCVALVTDSDYVVALQGAMCAP